MSIKAIPVSQTEFRADAPYTSNAWLHGRIQEDNGYDLVHLKTGLPEKTGIFVIELEGFSDRTLWGFCWLAKGRQYSLTPRKLMIIVDVTCQEDMEFARIKFTNQEDV